MVRSGAGAEVAVQHSPRQSCPSKSEPIANGPRLPAWAVALLGFTGTERFGNGGGSRPWESAARDDSPKTPSKSIQDTTGSAQAPAVDIPWLSIETAHFGRGATTRPLNWATVPAQMRPTPSGSAPI